MTTTTRRLFSDMLRAIALIFLLQVFGTTAEQCKNEDLFKPCDCTVRDDKIEILCNETTNSETKDMFEELPPGVSVNSFEYISDDVEYLRKNFFRKATVKVAIFSLPNLEMVHDEVFQGQETSLKWISFSSTKLTEIPVTILKHLRALKKFEFSDSPLVTVVESSPFKGYSGASGIQTLTYESNSISTLNNMSFAYLPSLFEINLNGNKLTELNPYILPSHMTSLSSFSVS